MIAPESLVVTLFIIIFFYSVFLAIGDLPDRHFDGKPKPCPKHTSTDFCACRKNLPKGKV